MILFVCTGNYYRSRFAEIYFNHQAARQQLDLRAFSRGFEAAAVRNTGPISVYTLAYLRELDLPVPPAFDFPVQLTETDFDRASAVIALDESEHRPMLLRDFPHRLAAVAFWQFPDIQFAGPSKVLPAIRKQVDLYLELYRQRKPGKITVTMIEFELKGHDFIALNDLLKVLHLVGSGGEANQRISAGEIQVNGAAEMQKRKKLRAGDKVLFSGKTIVIR